MLHTTDTIQEAIRPEDVRKVRKMLGLTQQEVAEQLEYRQGTIAKFENGLIPVSDHFVYKWNNAFPIKLDGNMMEARQTEAGISLKWKGTLQVPLSLECAARIEFSGKVTQASLRKLVRHLEMMVDSFPTEEVIA